MNGNLWTAGNDLHQKVSGNDASLMGDGRMLFTNVVDAMPFELMRPCPLYCFCCFLTAQCAHCLEFGKACMHCKGIQIRTQTRIRLLDRLVSTRAFRIRYQTVRPRFRIRIFRTGDEGESIQARVCLSMIFWGGGSKRASERASKLMGGMDTRINCSSNIDYHLRTSAHLFQE